MNWWDQFCKWWIDFFTAIGNWFVQKPEGQQFSNLDRIISALLFLIIGHYLIKLIMMGIRKLAGVKRGVEVDISAKTFTISFVGICLNVLLAIGVLAILNVNFASIASIFSAVTVAVGLALQNLISSAASGIILIRAKYFKTGDYIHLRHTDGEAEGFVTRIALISTSLRTFDGQKVVIPNDKLTKGVITNFTHEKQRRVVISFTIDYSSDTKAIKELIRETIQKDERVSPTPSIYIHLDELNTHGVTLKAKFWVNYDVYWDAKFDLTEEILIKLQENKVKIPYETIRVENKEN